MGIGYGATNIDLFDLSRPELGHTSFISNNIELISSYKHLYCGLSLSNLFTLNVLNNGTSINNNGILSINKLYSDLYGVCGFYFPTIYNKKVISPFFDLRLSPKTGNYPKFIGGLGLGIEVRQFLDNKKLLKYSILFSWLPIQKESPYGRSYLSILLGI